MKAAASFLFALTLLACTESRRPTEGAAHGQDGEGPEPEARACDDLCPIGSAFETGEEVKDSCLSDGVILADESGDFGLCVREEGCHGLCRFTLPCSCGLERLYPVTCLSCP